jgi:outer membrane protein assembly factor BamB
VQPGRVFRAAAALAVLAALLSASGGEPARPGAKKKKPAPAHGLSGEYFAGANFKELKSKHVDAKVDFVDVGKRFAPRVGGAKVFSVRWTGQFKSTGDGFHKFYTISEGSVRLWVDGKLLVDKWKRHRASEKSGEIRFRANRWYDIQLDYALPDARARGLVRLAFSTRNIKKKIVPSELLRPVRDIRDPYPDPYKAPPDFVAAFNNYCASLGWGKYREEYKKRMELSFEPTFYTLCDLSGYSKPEPRSTALVRAALAREGQGEYREALEIYQKVIDETPDDLYRISKYGVYVPVSQYCQRRILRFPARDRTFYRTKHDSRAKREYQQARRKNSQEGMAQIVGSMLATSYGGKAMLSLGDGALDRGHYLEALEYYLTVRDVFTDRELHTPELSLKITYCRKMLGDSAARKALAGGKGSLSAAERAKFRSLVRGAKVEKQAFNVQLASAPSVASDDYTLYPPSKDPLGIVEPVWRADLPGSRLATHSYTQPVFSQNSVIYRHKNIVYARSILNGELRWKNDLGGRVTWQNWMERQYPQEDLLVQDGLVFAPMYKVGPTLVALDETTGQLKWAYGPMVASTPEEANMRFEAAPTGGPRTVYAGYVLDNIEGEAHIDSEYGVIAFESTTGRIRWRRPVCRLKPGLFTAGFAVRRRNRIRSFTSPPLYNQGTVYYNTNAGAIVALDALSGRVKWSMRYPYYSFPQSVHDATRQFGRGGGTVSHSPVRVTPHSPMFWYNQRPLLVGEALYVLPVDSPYMFRLNRRNGQVVWTKSKGYPYGRHNRLRNGGTTFFMGPIKSGELLMVHTSRFKPVHLLDPATGKTVWNSGDLLTKAVHPTLRHRYGDNNIGHWAFGKDPNAGGHYGWRYQLAARPFLSRDGTLAIGGYIYFGYPWYAWSSHMAVLDLGSRKITDRRCYISGEWLARCQWAITNAHKRIKLLQEVPHKNAKLKWEIKILKEISKDTVYENQHGPFKPFSRITSKRYGTTFELRTGPKVIQLVYDRSAVKRAVAKRTDPAGLFARAELAVGESRLREASSLMKGCLKSISSEDVDFRSIVNQQLYKVHRRLARSGVRAGRSREELAECMGMRRTVNTLGEEIETLFALAEAYERKGDLDTSSRLLRSIISTYGHYQYPTPSLLAGDTAKLAETSKGVFARGEAFTANTLYGTELTRAVGLMKRGMPLYFSALSPLEKDLTSRAGELAAGRLIAIQKRSPDFAAKLEKSAAGALGGKGSAEQLYRLWEFPATRTTQDILDRLFGSAGAVGKGTLAEQATRRKRLWQLADAARVSGLKVPAAYRARVLAPPPPAAPRALVTPMNERKTDLSDARGTAWLVCERRGGRKVRPGLAFLAGRVKKKFDNKFVLRCVELSSGKVLWNAAEQRGGRWFEELRLKGKGREPGFFEAYVRGDVVVVHGLFDVLAFRLSDGKLKWRYRVPFNFEIKHAVASGDMLVLSGKAESLALYMPTLDPRGEVVWQEGEEGDVYIAPYFHGDRLVSVRKLPFNLTVRYRATGKLIGRLALPDLSLNPNHPLVDKGPKAFPAAHDGRMLVVTDGWYYIAIDVEKMKVVWKRLLDNSDATREPTMRFCLKDDYLAVVKKDFDSESIYMLSSRSGELLWQTDPKVASSPRPLYSMIIAGGKLYGIKTHPGQGFYFAAMDCKTGKDLYRPREEKGYGGKPATTLFPRLYGGHLVARIKDRQDFELKVFEVSKGKLVATVKVKGTGDFREHGRVSATVQNGALLLLGKNELKTGIK